jgi:hypothetical protein
MLPWRTPLACRVDTRVLDAPRRTDSDENQMGSAPRGLVGPPILAAAALSGGFLSIIEKPAERQAAAKIVGPTRVASVDVLESVDACFL